MSKGKIEKLAGLGSLTEEQLALGEEVGRADLTLTALAVATRVLSKAPPERAKDDLRAMKLLFHELADGYAELWQQRAEYLLGGDGGENA